MIVDTFLPLLVFGDRADRTRLLTGHRNPDNRVIRAVLETETAVHTGFAVNMRPPPLDVYRFFSAVNHARPGKTALTGVSYHILRVNAGVAGFIKHCKHGPCGFFADKRLLSVNGERLCFVVVFEAAAETRYHPHPQNLAVVIKAAAHRLAVLWRHFTRKRADLLNEPSLKLQPRYLYKQFAFQNGRVVVDVQHDAASFGRENEEVFKTAKLKKSKKKFDFALSFIAFLLILLILSPPVIEQEISGGQERLSSLEEGV
jgi:hypothetical protein